MLGGDFETERREPDQVDRKVVATLVQEVGRKTVTSSIDARFVTGAEPLVVDGVCPWRICRTEHGAAHRVQQVNVDAQVAQVFGQGLKVDLDPQ